MVPPSAFTQPAVPVTVLFRFSVAPVLTWKMGWTAAKARIGTLMVSVPPVTATPAEVRVKAVRAAPPTVWPVPVILRALIVLLTVMLFVVMAELTLTVSVAAAASMLVAEVAL